MSRNISIDAVARAFGLCAGACMRSAEAERCRAALIAAYCAPDRHYHDIRHIAAMLDLLERHGTAAVDWLSLRWAILYHDIVYDPRAPDNEEQSAAAMARDFTAMEIDAALAERVRELVLATRHGVAEVALDETAAFLVDLDLAVLASPPEAYDAYAAAIRAEYAHVPDDGWRLGRARVLQGFLDRPAIFGTVPLAAAWEAPARRNLAREIGILRNGR